MKKFTMKWVSRTPHTYNIFADDLAAAQARQTIALAHWQSYQIDAASINLAEPVAENEPYVLTWIERKRHSHEIIANNQAEAALHRAAILTSWSSNRFEPATIAIVEVEDDGAPNETVPLPLSIEPPSRR